MHFVDVKGNYPCTTLLEIRTFATLKNCRNRGQIVAIYLNFHDMMVWQPWKIVAWLKL
jgi:hypothetical protein